MDHLALQDLPVEIEYRYQLQIEDAEMISRYDKVIFIDATKENIKGDFKFDPLKPKAGTSFTTHAISPDQVLYLCKTLFHCEPKAYALAIQGYSFDLKLGLSENASRGFKRLKREFQFQAIL